METGECVTWRESEDERGETLWQTIDLHKWLMAKGLTTVGKELGKCQKGKLHKNRTITACVCELSRPNHKAVMNK